MMDDKTAINSAFPDDAPHRQPAVLFPASLHGIEWRALGSEHLYSLAHLVARIEASDNPPYRTSLDEIKEVFLNTERRQGIAGFATSGVGQGQMVAFSQVSLRFPHHAECLCEGGVDPRFRRLGVGEALVSWQTETARHMLSASGHTGPSQIVMNVDPTNDELEEHLTRLGYHWERTYYELRADLTSIPDAPHLGSYLTIEPWSDEWDTPIRHVANRILKREWGRQPLTEEQWLMGRTAFAPEWSFVAVDRKGDRPKVIGFLLASRYEQDWKALGWKEGYIDQMGVSNEGQHTSVVNTLIIASMKAQRLDGMDRIGAGLSSTNHSGAYAAYDSLGFHTVGETRLYAIEL